MATWTPPDTATDFSDFSVEGAFQRYTSCSFPLFWVWCSRNNRNLPWTFSPTKIRAAASVFISLFWNVLQIWDFSLAKGWQRFDDVMSWIILKNRECFASPHWGSPELRCFQRCLSCHSHCLLLIGVLMKGTISTPIATYDRPESHW